MNVRIPVARSAAVVATTQTNPLRRLFGCAALAGSALAGCGGSDDPMITAPTITTPPAALAVTEGQGVSCSAVASGSAPLTFAWRHNGSTIAGASSATYALAAATLADNAASF